MTNYIDNTRFEELIQDYINGKKEVQDELFDSIGLLIDRLMGGYSFKVDREEAKQETFLLILKILKNFRKENGKGFNYLSTVILNNLRLIYTKNKRYNEKIRNYTEYKLGTLGICPSSAGDLD